jgi:hypothetical protein
MSKGRLIAVLAAAFIAGLLVGYFGPQLVPQKTIYDKLNDAGISYTRATPSNGDSQFSSHLEFAWFERSVISQITSFPRFLNDYSEANTNRNAFDSVNVFVDSGSRVVWIEEWRNNNPANITFLRFYIYSEPS